MNQKYFIPKTRREGPYNRRYFKISYTAALRFGIVLPSEKNGIEVSFTGVETDEVNPHSGNRALKGILWLAGNKFENVILIDKPRIGQNPLIITFWPISQHPDAHESYTEPLVDTAMDGSPFDINIVATAMHEKFVENAGVSPATLMKLLYEQENQVLKDAAHKYGQLLDEAHQREAQAIDLAEKKIHEARLSKIETEEIKNKLVESTIKNSNLEEKNNLLNNEIEELKKTAFIKSPVGAQVVISEKVKLLKVYEGIKGKENQRAIILELSDGTIRANNWKNDFDARFQFAKSLIGFHIKTDVWGGYDGNKWFKNIYEVK